MKGERLESRWASNHLVSSLLSVYRETLARKWPGGGTGESHKNLSGDSVDVSRMPSFQPQKRQLKSAEKGTGRSCRTLRRSVSHHSL